MNEIQNSKLFMTLKNENTNLLCHWVLEFEIYLEFGAWNLGFIISILLVITNCL